MQQYATALGAAELTKPDTLTKIATSPATAQIKPLTSGWFAADGERGKQVLVEQTQPEPKSLLAPFEMLLLAGLVATVLARHVAHALNSLQSKTASH